MSVLKIVECKGFSKEEAFASLKFDPDSPVVQGCNATQAWTKAGKPVPGTKDFKLFAIEQLEKKTKNEPGYGIYIVIDSPKEDIRLRPYTIINNKTEEIRNWTLTYIIREDKLSITSSGEETEDDAENIADIWVVEPGLVVAKCFSKSEAIEKVKELITQTHKNYSIIPIKTTNITPIAAFGLYTPSNNAKKGTFFAIGIDKEETDENVTYY